MCKLRMGVGFNRAGHHQLLQVQAEDETLVHSGMSSSSKEKTVISGTVWTADGVKLWKGSDAKIKIDGYKLHQFLQCEFQDDSKTWWTNNLTV